MDATMTRPHARTMSQALSRLQQQEQANPVQAAAQAYFDAVDTYTKAGAPDHHIAAYASQAYFEAYEAAAFAIAPEPEHLLDVAAYLEADALQKRHAEQVQHPTRMKAGDVVLVYAGAIVFNARVDTVDYAARKVTVSHLFGDFLCGTWDMGAVELMAIVHGAG